MKPILGVCLIALTMCGVVAAQDPTAPEMRPGISVELPFSSQAVAMPEADQQDVTVVTITADGSLYAGKRPIALGEFAGLTSSTVYVKADARASYQQVLTVLSALGNHPVVLLTQPTAPPEAGTLSPPYGVSLAVGQR
jgi:biopolymer transport protein ExbD